MTMRRARTAQCDRKNCDRQLFLEWCDDAKARRWLAEEGWQVQDGVWDGNPIVFCPKHKTEHRVCQVCGYPPEDGCGYSCQAIEQRAASDYREGEEFDDE